MKDKFFIILGAITILVLLVCGCDDGLDHSECRVVGYQWQLMMIPMGNGFMPIWGKVEVVEHHCKPRKAVQR